ncbi:MAG: protein-L-isoaspartate(D-aspartate) O-methyltransferase [Anaerolineales bacterium]
MTEENEYTLARERMVRDQIVPRRISDERVLSAMRTVPRHRFVPPDLRHLAYTDAPLPIGHRQTISQPYIVALMTSLLELKEDDKVFEVGTGSGYQAAILAHIANQVFTIERIGEIADKTRELFQELGLKNIHVVEGDGSLGLEEEAPFDAIIVTAAAPKVPEPLKEQLADGGRMVLPVGGRNGQILELWKRKGRKLEKDRLAPVAFVPLVGDQGWESEEGPHSWWR